MPKNVYVARLDIMVSNLKEMQSERFSQMLTQATAHLSAPLSLVDLTAFDENARHMATRTHGKPIRLATKSVRNRTLISRALRTPGYQGLMCYSLAEALWLVSEGYTDILVAYPSVDRAAIAELAANEQALAEIVLIVDSEAHLKILHASKPVRPISVALDIDSSLRIFARTSNPIHIGVRRSGLYLDADVTRLLDSANRYGSVRIVGAMFYDAQIAGLPDSSAIVRMMKQLSRAELGERRREIVSLMRERLGELRLVNGGGTGSIADFERAHEVTEVTAGSGLYYPTLFDGYRGLGLNPSAYFGLDVVRQPRNNIATAFAGGYMASGEVGKSRQPKLIRSGYKLSGQEGVGEVQTPVFAQRGIAAPQVGERVWLRHAKAGEQMERFNTTYLLSGTQIVDDSLTYRGEGKNFG